MSATTREQLARLRRLPVPVRERTADQEARLLERRARALARPVAPDADETPADTVLLVSLGSDRRTIAVAHVLDVTPFDALTPVPGTPPYVLGLTSRRGRVLAVCDLAPVLGLAGPVTPREIVAVELGDVAFGIVVDASEGPLPQTAANRLAPSLDLQALVAERRLEIDHEGER